MVNGWCLRPVAYAENVRSSATEAGSILSGRIRADATHAVFVAFVGVLVPAERLCGVGGGGEALADSELTEARGGV